MSVKQNNKIIWGKIIQTPLIILAFFLCVPSVFAQAGSLALTITPPIFQMTVTPGTDWKSAIKVTNNNTYDITVYASVLNFEASGEGGGSRFIPIVHENEETVGRLLSDWIIVSPQPFPIPAGKSINVPYMIRTPFDAEPGGHYAAIMIGTRPVVQEEGGSSMKISSLISSLIFAKVEGEVVELGRIREFSTEKSFYQTPEAQFSLRFENVGNVHMIPRGDIIITNMWGKERGRIKINENIGYGTVLPGVIRNFKYEWTGEDNIFEIGRYSAVATIVYGEEERQSEYYTTSFWVIPMKPVLSVLGFLVLFIGFIYWSIRRYIRKSLELELKYTQMYNAQLKASQANQLRQQPASRPVPAQQPVQQRVVRPAPQQIIQRPVQKMRPQLQTLARPIINGAVDLRSLGSTQAGENEAEERPQNALGFLNKYKLFFIFITVLIAGGVIISQFFGEVLVPERNFKAQEILEENGTF